MLRSLFSRGDRLNAKWESYQLTNLLLDLVALLHPDFTKRESGDRLAVGVTSNVLSSALNVRLILRLLKL